MTFAGYTTGLIVYTPVKTNRMQPILDLPCRSKKIISQFRLTKKAYDRLLKAKKKGESLSDVIIRLSEAKVTALQRRGEKEIMTSDSRKLVVEIDQDKCAGAESCVSVAPAVFALDPTELGGFRRGREPFGMKEVEERTVDSDTIITAAKSCPYHAIYVKDVETGEELAG